MMNLQELTQKTKLYLFDLDGTLYLGDRLFSFTAELLRAIRENGADYLFMTNNSSKSVSDYVKKLQRLGIAATPADFITSAQATAHYLKQHHLNDRLFVFGTRSLQEEIRDSGFLVTEDEAKTDCIVLGFDTELTFRKLDTVCRMLCRRDLPYIATHPDLVCPTEYGSVPDCGSVAKMIFNATGKRPLVIGKPEPLMVQLAMRRIGVTENQTAVIGDRLYTDIQCGLNAGVATVLVFSGETTSEMLQNSPIKPHYTIDSCAALLRCLK